MLSNASNYDFIFNRFFFRYLHNQSKRSPKAAIQRPLSSLLNTCTSMPANFSECKETGTAENTKYTKPSASRVSV